MYLLDAYLSVLLASRGISEFGSDIFFLFAIHIVDYVGALMAITP